MMKDCRRDNLIFNLVNEGQRCKEGRDLVTNFFIIELAIGFCSLSHKECWLNCCDNWISNETLLAGRKRIAKPLFLERQKERAVVNIKLSSSGIRTGIIKIGSGEDKKNNGNSNTS